MEGNHSQKSFSWDSKHLYMPWLVSSFSPPSFLLSLPQGDNVSSAELYHSCREQNELPSQSPHCATRKHRLTMGSTDQPIRATLCTTGICCQADWGRLQSLQSYTPLAEQCQHYKHSTVHGLSIQISVPATLGKFLYVEYNLGRILPGLFEWMYAAFVCYLCEFLPPPILQHHSLF